MRTVTCLGFVGRRLPSSHAPIRTTPMSTNAHGMPSRVRAIAELGRLLADASVDEPHKLRALELLVQDHADLDEVEAGALLWALMQPAPGDVRDAARDALLVCAPQLLHSSDPAWQVLDTYAALVGADVIEQAQPAFARALVFAGQDAALAARLQAFAAS